MKYTTFEHLEQKLASRDAEIESLRRQLEQAHADIAGLHNQLEEPQITQDEYNLERDQLRQHVVMLRDMLNYAADTYDSVWTKGMPVICGLVEKVLDATAPKDQ